MEGVNRKQSQFFLDMVAVRLDVPIEFCEKAFRQTVDGYATPEKLYTPFLLAHMISAEEPLLMSRGKQDNATVKKFLHLVNEQHTQNPNRYYREQPKNITCFDDRGNVVPDHTQYAIDAVLEVLEQAQA